MLKIDARLVELRPVLATRIAGEAGPEAVIPLRRGRDGRLGVAAHGAPSEERTVTVHAPVTVIAPEPAKFNQSRGQISRTVGQAWQRARRFSWPSEGTSRNPAADTCFDAGYLIGGEFTHGEEGRIEDPEGSEPLAALADHRWQRCCVLRSLPVGYDRIGGIPIGSHWGGEPSADRFGSPSTFMLMACQFELGLMISAYRLWIRRSVEFKHDLPQGTPPTGTDGLILSTKPPFAPVCVDPSPRIILLERHMVDSFAFSVDIAFNDAVACSLSGS